MMLWWDNPRSAIVVGLKIILPLWALSLLSTLFLFSGKIDVTLSIPYAQHRVDELIESEQVKSPVLSGVTDKGTSYVVAADRSKSLLVIEPLCPAQPKRLILSQVIRSCGL